MIRRLAFALCLAASVTGTPGANATAARTNWQAIDAGLFAGSSHGLRQSAMRAYVWGMPLVEAALIRERFVAAGRINRFSHRRSLAGPEMRVGVAPNNDTLYSLAWIDLADGPLVLTAPNFHERYYTFSINQADSSAEQSLGQRTHGGHLPPVFLHAAGDGLKPPPGMIDAPVATRYANLAGRILVRGPDEYPVVHALQDAIHLVRWSDYAAGRTVDAPPPSQPPRAIAPSDPALSANERFIAELGNVARDWRVRPSERAMIAELARLGITRSGGFDRCSLNAARWAQVARGLDDGRALVARRSLDLGVQVRGWSTNYLGPRFGNDRLLRAGVAKDAIYVAIPEEALYSVVGSIQPASRCAAGPGPTGQASARGLDADRNWPPSVGVRQDSELCRVRCGTPRLPFLSGKHCAGLAALARKSAQYSVRHQQPMAIAY